MTAVTLPLAMLGRVLGDAFEWTRNSFPRVVRIETTNHCNAACSFCPRESIGRPKTFMDQTLFENVVDQCARGGTRMIHMHHFGEPLLDKKLPERIRYAKDRGIEKVKIFCNGSLLRGALADRLLESGLDEIKVSIDGATPKEFNQLRIGLDHGEVLENTRNFRRLRDERRPGGKPTIVAACVASSDKTRTEALLKDVVDRIDWASLHNWAGARRFLGDRQVRKPCIRIFRTLTVLVNGDVALCCLDHAGREVLGNCREQTIREIWNNHRYREIRKLHRTSRQDQIDLCSNCTKCFY